MANSPSERAKIYDRPERKAMSPLVIVVLALVLVVVGYFMYRAFAPAPRPVSQGQTGHIPLFSPLWEGTGAFVRPA